MTQEELYDRLGELEDALSEKEADLRWMKEELSDAQITLYQSEHPEEFDSDETADDLANDKAVAEERIEYFTQQIEEVEDEISMIQREIEQVEFGIEMSHEDEMGF